MAIEREMTFNDYILIIKRRLPYVIGSFFLIFLLATAIALKIPTIYQSTAVILIESQQVQSDANAAKGNYASDRFEALKQVVLSQDNLFKIASKYGLYGLDKKPRPPVDVVKDFRTYIKADLLKADADAWEGKPTFALEVSFLGNKAEDTYHVTTDLYKLFLEENERSNKLRVTDTAEFYSKEAEKQKVALLKIEKEVAKYKQTHSNSLPQNRDMQLGSLDRLELDLRENQRAYSATQAELLSLDVSMESAKAGIGLNTPQEQAAGATELEKSKSELEKLSGLYSDNHPSVRALKRRIEVLEASSTPIVGKHVTAQSVMVAKVQAQIDTANARLKSLEREEASIRAKMSQTEGRVMQSAQTEGELGTLLREYENAKSAYAELKVKQDSAKIAKNIEMENKGERFVLSEAPILPEKPIKPNRIMILLAGFFGSIAGAIGLAVLMEALDKRVRGVAAFASIMKIQPIATIPYITNTAELKRRKYLIVKTLISILAILILVLLLVHAFVMPLDILKSKILAKF